MFNNIFCIIYTVFIYSMPGYSCPIKVRMLYSSCKLPFIEELENIYKLKIHKKVKIYLCLL